MSCSFQFSVSRCPPTGTTRYNLEEAIKVKRSQIHPRKMHSLAVSAGVSPTENDSLPTTTTYTNNSRSAKSIAACSVGFVAKSVAPDGVPPGFLKRKGWTARFSTPRSFQLGEAPGLDTALRARLPQFDFPLSCKNSQPLVVGKWYCPFIFIKDGAPKDQMAKSRYYEMTLEQRWEQVFACNNDYNEDNMVVVDVRVEGEEVRVNGMSREISLEDRETMDGVMWFGGSTAGVGLSLVIVERMKWEEERFGWNDGHERLKRVEKMEKNGVWNKYGCYVLVERFVLRRMDGSLVLTYDFKHTHVVRNKWE